MLIAATGDYEIPNNFTKDVATGLYMDFQTGMIFDPSTGYVTDGVCGSIPYEMFYPMERVENPTKGESDVWKDLDNVKGKDRKNSGKGKDKQYYEWDHTHNDIEVFS